MISNPLNPRDEDDPELEQLVATLQSAGQLQPVMVVSRERYLRAYPDQARALGRAKWVVLAGNRRLLAARKANFRRIDVHEVEYDTQDAINQAILIENTQRRDLPPMKEAEVLKALMKPRGRTVRSVGTLIGKSHTYVQHRLDLLKLIPEFQDMLNAGQISIATARSTAIKPEEVQRQLFLAGQNRDGHRQGSLKDGPSPQVSATNAAAIALKSALVELNSICTDEVSRHRLDLAKDYVVTALDLLGTSASEPRPTPTPDV